MIDALPQVIYQAATNPHFRFQLQADPHGAVAAYGLSLSDEEWLALLEVQGFFSNQSLTELMSSQHISQPHLISGWIGSEKTFTPAALADDRAV